MSEERHKEPVDDEAGGISAAATSVAREHVTCMFVALEKIEVGKGRGATRSKAMGDVRLHEHIVTTGSYFATRHDSPDSYFVDVTNPRLGRVEYVWVGVVRPDHLNELHHLHRIEEVNANETVRAAGDFSHLGDGEGGGVGGEDCLGLTGGAERSVDLRATDPSLEYCFISMPQDTRLPPSSGPCSLSQLQPRGLTRTGRLCPSCT